MSDRPNPPNPPKVCPGCGAVDAYRRRYVTGGGWRVVSRCVECGRQHVSDAR